MSRGKIVVGSRGSRLALVQAGSVAARLKVARPDQEIEVKKIVTGGDRDRRTGLDSLGIGVFVKELEDALLDRRIDLAVHSLKDMPTDIPDGLRLAAAVERADPRDVLVTRGETLEDLPPGSRIGTGSLRRSIQLARLRGDLDIRGLRGNVDTRLRRVREGDLDGVILAAAGLLRLGGQDRITQYLPPADFLPAPGQGVIAVEMRRDDEALYNIVAGINDITAWRCAAAERAFLSALGGGCRAPIAALATIEGDRLFIRGLAASSDGKKVLRGSAEGEPSSAEVTGEGLARKLLAEGAAEFIEGANGIEDR